MSRSNSPLPRSDKDGEKRTRRRRSKRRFHDVESGSGPVCIRIGDPSIEACYRKLIAHSERDGDSFVRIVNSTLEKLQGLPLLIIVSGWREWLGKILARCVKEEVRSKCERELSERNREVQDTGYFRFPERHVLNKEGKEDTVTWSFVIDQINLPQAYQWSMDPSIHTDPDRDAEDPDLEQYRFRLGVWTCAEGLENVSVTIIFTKPDTFSESRPTPLCTLLLKTIYYGGDNFLEKLFERDNDVEWIFLKLWTFLTDWENVLKEFEDRLEIAESNSENDKGPAYIRTRESHAQIRQIFILLQYLHLHLRSFQRLADIQCKRNGAGECTPGTILGDVRSVKAGRMQFEYAHADLSQFKEEFKLLIERYKNLTEYEFNMDNAKQAAGTRILTIIATVFLPPTLISSIWGMTEFHGSTLLFAAVAAPILLFSISIAPYILDIWRKFKEGKTRNGVHLRKKTLSKENVRLLGREIPGSNEKLYLQRELRVRKRRSTIEMNGHFRK